MSNYTATTNMTLEEAITAGSMVTGDNLTINNGAIITCTQTPSIIIDQVDINNGILKIDGENITSGNIIWFKGNNLQEINVNGQGKLQAIGDWHTIGTTDGTDSQVITFSENPDVIPMVQVETGRRLILDNISGPIPEIDDWIYKTADEKVMGRIVQIVEETASTAIIIVKFLTGTLNDNDAVFVRKLIDNSGPDLQISFTANIDNTEGDIKEAGVYQEFGNCVANGTSYISGFHHGVGGFVFENQYQSTSLTFGSSAGATGGFKPPSGCNIRIPNVHFMSDTATGNNETERFQLITTNAGEIDLKVCNVGSAWFGCTNASKFDAEFVGCNVDIGSNNAGSKTTFKNCVRCPDPIGHATSTRYAFRGLDLISGTSIIDCLGIMCESERCPIGAETNIGVEVKGCISTLHIGAKWSTNSIYCYYFSRSQDVVFENNVAVGSDHAEFDGMFNLNGTPKVKVKNFKMCCSQAGIEQTQEKNGILLSAFSNDCEFIGLEFIGNATQGNYMMQITDCINIKVRCMGQIDNKVSFGVDGERLVYLTGLCSNIDLARLWGKDGIGGTSGNVTVAPVTAKNVLVQNCSMPYNSEIQLTGNDGILFKGVHGGSGNVSASDGWEDLLAASYGHNIHDCFKSDTTGAIGLVFITPSATINETTITAGNPLFYKDGDLDMVNGDVIEFEQSYFMTGHTGFTGNFTAATGSSNLGNDEWGNVSLAFQYQLKGGSWNGTWLDVRTASNWTAITGDTEEGIKFKFQLTATGTQTSMSMLLVETTTTLTAQQANLYPIDQNEITLTLTGIHDNTEIRVYKVSDETEIAGVENSSGDFFANITYPGADFNVDIVIHHINYQYIRLENVTITEDNLTIPIQQIQDTAYLDL